MKAILLALFISISAFSSSSRASETGDIISQLVESNQLKGYWHVDSFPERVPLVVHLPSGLKKPATPIEMFGHPVEFSHAPDSGSTALIIKRIRRDDAELVLEFSYSPEGIRGEASYVKSSSGWSLRDVKVYES